MSTLAYSRQAYGLHPRPRRIREAMDQDDLSVVFPKTAKGTVSSANPIDMPATDSSIDKPTS